MNSFGMLNQNLSTFLRFAALIGVVTSAILGTQNVNIATRVSLAISLIEAAGVPVRYVGKGKAISTTQLARNCVPLVWRLKCNS